MGPLSITVLSEGRKFPHSNPNSNFDDLPFVECEAFMLVSALASETGQTLLGIPHSDNHV